MAHVNFSMLASALLLSASAALPSSVLAADDKPRGAVALGRYLVTTTGCNDCHSPGYTQSGGKTPESTWLTGESVGWRGPWGTTYGINLRLYFDGLTEAQWLAHARQMTPRPPMPWFNLRAMTDGDLQAIYRYVKAAGPAGLPAPAYVPPGQPVKGPVVQFP